MQFQKHFKSASPISLLLAQIVTSVFGFAVYFLFATPVTMYIAYTGREDEILRTAVTIIGTVFAVMVGTASTPLLNLRFEKTVICKRYATRQKCFSYRPPAQHYSHGRCTEQIKTPKAIRLIFYCG